MPTTDKIINTENNISRKIPNPLFFKLSLFLMIKMQTQRKRGKTTSVNKPKNCIYIPKICFFLASNSSCVKIPWSFSLANCSSCIVMSSSAGA
jgi:hypothetical protein